MNKDLVSAYTPTNIQQAIELATMLSTSGMVPKDYIGKPGAIVAAMEMGAKLGLSAMQSCQGIAVINGRPSIWGDAALGVIQSQRDFAGIDEDGADVAAKQGFGRCKVLRRFGDRIDAIERRFSRADAKAANLAGKAGPWTQYEGRMLQMRARSWAMRDAFADALKGLGIAEEVRDIVEAEGSSRVVLSDMLPKPKAAAAEVVDATPLQEAPAATPTPTTEAPKPTVGAAPGEVVVKVMEIKETSGEKNGKPWKKYGVVVDNFGQVDTLGTFSSSVAESARELIGKEAFAVVSSKEINGKTYFNLESIRLAVFDVSADDEVRF